MIDKVLELRPVIEALVEKNTCVTCVAVVPNALVFGVQEGKKLLVNVTEQRTINAAGLDVLVASTKATLGFDIVIVKDRVWILKEK